MSPIIGIILSQPIIRAFLIEIAARVFMEFYATLDSDPEYRLKFMALSAELSRAKTPEEKRNALKAIEDLRAPKPATPSE